MGRNKCFERNDVLNKSIQLFWRKGYADTSLHDLEKATGVNKSGLYSEFKDKEDLFTQSLKHYAETNGVIELLSHPPLGRKNIEDFLMAGQQCSGQKGCFVANTIREISILPKSAKTEIQKHTSEIRQALIENLIPLMTKNNAEVTADTILTFNSGMALRLNMGEVVNLDKLVKYFLDKILLS